jgi:DNA-binding GntR family transcriptional regulator
VTDPTPAQASPASVPQASPAPVPQASPARAPRPGPAPLPQSGAGGLDEVDRPDLLVERVETTLREAILSGQLAPGSHLSVPEIARRLGVSRTPAREALFALHRLGLVEVRPHRGAVVVAGGHDDLRELFELREALEGMAARLAALHMPEPGLAELNAALDAHREAVEAGDIDAHVQWDLRFHELIAAGSANRRLVSSISQLGDQISVLMRLNSGRPGAMDESVLRAHGRIVRSIGRHDGDQAELRMREHIRAVFLFMSGAS